MHWSKPTHTNLFCNFAAVVKVIKSENPFLAVVILYRNITLQILCEQKNPHFFVVVNLNTRGQQRAPQGSLQPTSELKKQMFFSI